MVKKPSKRIVGIGVAATGFFIIALLVACAALGSGGAANEQIGNVERRGGTQGSSLVTSSINYQGSLTGSGGNLLNGTYDMTFSLYEGSSGGVPLASDTHAVQCINGLFNTQITFDSSFFDGRALWLGIKVGADSEMTPRQELRPVPYALGALGLQQGSEVIGSTSPTFSVTNTGTGHAIFGIAEGTGDIVNYGGYFEAYGRRGRGVSGATNGDDGVGVYGWAQGSNGVGVQGYSVSGGGVWGTNGNSGNYGVLGGSWYGVYGESNSSEGVVGISGTGPGVRGQSTNGYGGYFTSGNDHLDLELGGAVGRINTDHTNENSNLYLSSNNDIIAKLDNDGGENGVFRIENSGSTDVCTVDEAGKMTIRSGSTGAILIELGEGLDYAEGFAMSDINDIAPGTVLIIDQNNPGNLTISNTPYDRKVGGIVTGAKGLGSGVRLGGGQFECDVALAGRVYCSVDATEAAVEPGDLLTTSALPGYAMKVTDYERAQGAILGKAMEPLEEGEKGQILVLVTLQ